MSPRYHNLGYNRFVKVGIYTSLPNNWTHSSGHVERNCKQHVLLKINEYSLEHSCCVKHVLYLLLYPTQPFPLW